MGKKDKLIRLAVLNTEISKVLNENLESLIVYRSKGLISHLIKRKHYVALKYINMLPDIIERPDYAGYYKGNVELVKCYSDNIFVSIRIDSNKKYYYVTTVFEVKKSKIDSYVKSGRINKVTY